jgi:uncharacterized membrane protein
VEVIAGQASYTRPRRGKKAANFGCFCAAGVLYAHRVGCPELNARLSKEDFMGGSPQTPSSSGGGLQPNIAALLAYIFWIPAILWLLIEPFKNDRFVRFHSWQALVIGVVWFVIYIVLTITVIGLLITPLIMLAQLGVAILGAYKSYKNEMYKFPLIGDFCEKQAGG